MRTIAPEVDPLRLGCGWTRRDLGKPLVVIESSAGDSHPGSVHLGELCSAIWDGIMEAGGRPSRYICTDACDGITQGTDAMDLSLCIREIIALATELHVRSALADGVLLVSACDKAIPGHLIAAARLGIPALHFPGGSMSRGAGDMSLDKIGDLMADLQRGKVSEEEYQQWIDEACPGPGACQFLGTANTMQVMAEALGLALPGTALAPTSSYYQRRRAVEAGNQIIRLIERGLTVDQVLTQQAIENAMVVHAAFAGSSNALLHLPALARTLGLRCTLEMFQEANDRTPWIVNVRPSGRWDANLVWMAGGVPRVMDELRDWLHLDALTVTGKTVGENLDDLQQSGYFDRQPLHLANYGLTCRDVIASVDEPLAPRGGITILKGNIAPEGAVIKEAAVRPKARRFCGPARVFDCQEDAIAAIFAGRAKAGDAVIIRFEGPRGSGMPEQFYVTKAISSDEELSRTMVLITDGRFSGASGGPAICHVCPEAAAGGPIGVLRDGDWIEMDIDAKSLNMIGEGDRPCSVEDGSRILDRRLRESPPLPPPKQEWALLNLYTTLAQSAVEGAGMKFPFS
ncbi:MAG: dihydroxy-acid dehydratase [Candidatus Zipacnadales bacterium]